MNPSLCLLRIEKDAAFDGSDIYRSQSVLYTENPYFLNQIRIYGNTE